MPKTNTNIVWHPSPDKDDAFFRTFHGRPDGSFVWRVESGAVGARCGFKDIDAGFYYDISDVDPDPIGPFATAQAAMAACDKASFK